MSGSADAQLARRTYTDTLEVHNLNLEVVVSDRDGQRASGLTMAFFDVYGGKTYTNTIVKKESPNQQPEGN